jgi:hypothetical protein
MGLSKVGNLLKAQSDLNGAVALYRESLDLMRDVAAKDPGNAL